MANTLRLKFIYAEKYIIAVRFTYGVSFGSCRIGNTQFDKSSERTQEFLTTLYRLQCAHVYVPKHRGLTTLYHTQQNAQFIFHKLTVD